ncbi:MAG: DUF2510 domain-containing protein [Pseudolysinimonas sp.]
MTDPTPTVPPGWYPDTSAPGWQRWWDGTQWTEHVHPPQYQAVPYQVMVPAKAPDGTKPGTIWIWLIVLLPVLNLISLFTIDWVDYIDSSVVSSTYPTTPVVYSSPAYVISQILGWVIYAVTVVFAALDVRALKRRGVPQPFHWAFAFLPTLVYVIGRSVVVKRRTGTGYAPMWVFIGITAITVIAFIVLMVFAFQYMFASFPTTIT